MNIKIFALAGAAGGAMVTGAATAAFSGVSIESFTGAEWVANGYDTGALKTYRLYANFDGQGDDGVLSAFGVSGVPASIHSTSGTFFNSNPDSLTAPQDLTGFNIWENQWDTYVTIGATDSQGDATTLSPGFASATNSLATDWTSENIGWFVTPDDDQSLAVERSPGVFSVMLGQFTVEDAGDANDIFGLINVLARDGVEYTGNMFTTAMPAPGVLALLGLAGLAGTRRRK